MTNSNNQCSRCDHMLPDAEGSFWREPVHNCPSCGTRHQRESRLGRLVSWCIAMPVILVFLFIWLALAILLAQLIYFEGRLTLLSSGAAIGLIMIPVYPGKYLYAAVKELLSKRKTRCLEK